MLRRPLQPPLLLLLPLPQRPVVTIRPQLLPSVLHPPAVLLPPGLPDTHGCLQRAQRPQRPSSSNSIIMGPIRPMEHRPVIPPIILALVAHRRPISVWLSLHPPDIHIRHHHHLRRPIFTLVTTRPPDSIAAINSLSSSNNISKSLLQAEY